jgi:hypothetical protein
MARIRWALVLFVASLALAPIGSLYACGLDGVPSISGNGVLAQRNSVRASPSHLGHWAQFVIPRSFGAGASVRLTENVAELHRTLLPSAFGRPWRWSFGDGTTATGFDVTHAYKHSGDYKLVVSAFYSNYKTWFQFDDALVHIVAAKTTGSK